MIPVSVVPIKSIQVKLIFLHPCFLVWGCPNGDDRTTGNVIRKSDYWYNRHALRSWSVTPLLRQWTVQQNVKEQASRKESRVKTILARCSEPLRSAAQSHNSSDHCDDTLLTLLIPSFDTQVRHIFHFLLETSDWIPAKPSPPPLYLLCDLDKTQPLFSSQNS